MAIILAEAEEARFHNAITHAGQAFVSAGTWIELGAVIARGGLAKWSAVEIVRSEYRLAIAPVTPRQAEIGADAYRRYGIGTGHPARLNFGDCFAYALAIERGEPLLFKGEDFIHTDVIRAEY